MFFFVVPIYYFQMYVPLSAVPPVYGRDSSCCSRKGHNVPLKVVHQNATETIPFGETILSKDAHLLLRQAPQLDGLIVSVEWLRQFIALYCSHTVLQSQSISFCVTLRNSSRTSISAKPNRFCPRHFIGSWATRELAARRIPQMLS